MPTKIGIKKHFFKMRQQNINVYQFSELDEQSKQKAISKISEFIFDDEWWDFIFEDAKDIGLKITSFDLDRNRHTKGEFILSACEVAQNIISNHGEDTETYKTADSFLNIWQPVFNEYMDETSENYESRDFEDKLMEIEEDFLNDILEDYSIMLQKEYEFRLSDEYIIDFIEANEYEFYENGTIF